MSNICINFFAVPPILPALSPPRRRRALPSSPLSPLPVAPSPPLCALPSSPCSPFLAAPSPPEGPSHRALPSSLRSPPIHAVRSSPCCTLLAALITQRLALPCLLLPPVLAEPSRVPFFLLRRLSGSPPRRAVSSSPSSSPLRVALLSLPLRTLLSFPRSPHLFEFSPPRRAPPRDAVQCGAARSTFYDKGFQVLIEQKSKRTASRQSHVADLNVTKSSPNFQIWRGNRPTRFSVVHEPQAHIP